MMISENVELKEEESSCNQLLVLKRLWRRRRRGWWIMRSRSVQCGKVEEEHGGRKGEMDGCDECFGWVMEGCVKRSNKGVVIDRNKPYNC